MLWSATDVEGVVYLDYNATAPLRTEAFEAMLPHLQGVGNAGSPHVLGRRAAAAIEDARRQVGDLLGCSPGEIIFTSGATEANNLALRAAAGRSGCVVATAVEHPTVLATARAITEERGQVLNLLQVDSNGDLDVEHLANLLAARPVEVVSVMAANNETGVINDLAPVVAAGHRAGALVHTDATQFVGRLPFDLAELDVDLLSLSAHKFGGPQGVGALFIRRGVQLLHRPAQHGGGQERGWRSGTLNVAGIAGAGAAAEAAGAHMRLEMANVRRLRDRLESGLLSKVPDAVVNGRAAHRLPGVTNIHVPGTPADAVLAALPTVAASDGSACASGAPTPSHVLTAMGLSRESADCCLRFSLGHASTTDDVDSAVPAIVDAVMRVRRALNPASAPVPVPTPANPAKACSPER